MLCPSPFFALTLGLLAFGCAGVHREGDVVVQREADLEDLAHYTRVTGTIVIKNTLVEAIVLPRLEQAGGLVIEENAPNLRLVSLPALREIDILKIKDNPQTERVELPRLAMARTLVVSGNDALEDLELPMLARLDSLELRDNRRLRSSSLPGLTQVAIAGLHDNPTLERLHLPALATASRLEVSGHAALQIIELPALTHLANLELTRNPALRAVRLERLEVLDDLQLDDNAVLTTFHTAPLPSGTPRSRSASVRASPKIADPEAFRSRRGDLRQLAIARVGAQRLLILGYRRQDRAVFEARDAATGALAWTSRLEAEYDPKHHPPASWPTTVPGSAGQDLVTVHIEDGRFEADGPHESDVRLVGQVVGLDPSTGAELWRSTGSRSWVLGRDVIGAGPQAAFHLPSTYTLHTIHRLADGHAAVMHLFDIFDMVTVSDHGHWARFAFRGAPVFGPEGQVAMLCARDLRLDAFPDLRGSFQPCPDPGPELVPLPPPLAAMAQGVLAPKPDGRRYLATTDGRVAPSPILWGGALMEPAHEGVEPVAFFGSRLAWVVYGQGEPGAGDRLFLASLDPSTPSMTAVEGLDDPHVLGPIETLGRHLVFLTSSGKDGPRTLRLVDLETASLGLSLPLGRTRLVTNDGLVGFELDLEPMGPVTVWIGAPPTNPNSTTAPPRPELVAAYQLRDAGDRHRPVAIEVASATPETAALGEGLHAVRLRIDGNPWPFEDTGPHLHGGALIDIRARRLVWSDLETLHLVDFTEQLRERWNLAWRAEVPRR